MKIAKPLTTKNKAPHLVRGEQAEADSCQFLISQGQRLIEKNYRCQFGEIDLIMLEKNTLVFVEVRFRKNNHFGGAIESITAKKQLKVRRTAEYYLQNNSQYINARFDVIAVTPSATSEQDSFNWIKDAF